MTEIGSIDGTSGETIDADGLIVAPGFIDPHTHYDAQLFWDPTATPSSWHGVTTVIGGNCGFTFAPIKPADVDYTCRMMAQVEGMPLAALTTGVPWSWDSFGEYLDHLDGAVAVNAGFIVGHCALRRYVLGEDFGRESTADELQAIKNLLDQSLASGGLGLSTTRSSTHIDGEGQPVPSRWASEDEVLGLCGIVGRHEGTSLELITEGCIGRFSDHEVELLATMSATARRPLNWNVLSVSSDDPGKIEHQLQPSKRAPRDRRPGRGTDHARLRRQQHELPHLLRVVADSRLAGCPCGRRPRARSSGCATPQSEQTCSTARADPHWAGSPISVAT